MGIVLEPNLLLSLSESCAYLGPWGHSFQLLGNEKSVWRCFLTSLWSWWTPENHTQHKYRGPQTHGCNHNVCWYLQGNHVRNQGFFGGAKWISSGSRLAHVRQLIGNVPQGLGTGGRPGRQACGRRRSDRSHEKRKQQGQMGEISTMGGGVQIWTRVGFCF